MILDWSISNNSSSSPSSNPKSSSFSSSSSSSSSSAFSSFSLGKSSSYWRLLCFFFFFCSPSDGLFLFSLTSFSSSFSTFSFSSTSFSSTSFSSFSSTLTGLCSFTLVSLDIFNCLIPLGTCCWWNFSIPVPVLLTCLVLGVFARPPVSANKKKYQSLHFIIN
ncbi:hypothetical protein HYPBUDRAFT_184169, partial [Hyphopichia burtonii NRRL Y-1933]